MLLCTYIFFFTFTKYSQDMDNILKMDLSVLTGLEIEEGLFASQTMLYGVWKYFLESVVIIHWNT